MTATHNFRTGDRIQGNWSVLPAASGVDNAVDPEG